jgi:hypothetical protein
VRHRCVGPPTHLDPLPPQLPGKRFSTGPESHDADITAGPKALVASAGVAPSCGKAEWSGEPHSRDSPSTQTRRQVRCLPSDQEMATMNRGRRREWSAKCHRLWEMP